MKKKTQDRIKKIRGELFDLEEPLHTGRHTAEALRMIGSSDFLRGDQGDGDLFRTSRRSRRAGRLLFNTYELFEPSLYIGGRATQLRHPQTNALIPQGPIRRVSVCRSRLMLIEYSPRGGSRSAPGYPISRTEHY